MDVDTLPRTKMVQYIQNPEILQLSWQIMNIFQKVEVKNV